MALGSQPLSWYHSGSRQENSLAFQSNWPSICRAICLGEPGCAAALCAFAAADLAAAAFASAALCAAAFAAAALAAAALLAAASLAWRSAATARMWSKDVIRVAA